MHFEKDKMFSGGHELSGSFGKCFDLSCNTNNIISVILEIDFTVLELSASLKESDQVQQFLPGQQLVESGRHHRNRRRRDPADLTP